MSTPRHRSPRPHRGFAPARLFLNITQVAAVSCLLSLGLLTATSPPENTPTPQALDGASITYEEEIHDAMTRFQCFDTSLVADVIPSSALIRSAAGELEHVTFDRGWAVHTQRTHPATLIAVCASEPPSR